MPPLIELPALGILLANVALWALGHAGAGYLAHRLPPGRLAHDGPVLRLRRFEAGGRVYERRLGIRAWKDRIPEAGDLFAGGTSKRTLATAAVGRDAALAAFRIEARRAERAHWGSLVVLPLFWIWNPPIGVALMAVYGVVVNLPFILVQRYNRARIERIVGHRARRAPMAPPVLSGAGPSPVPPGPGRPGGRVRRSRSGPGPGRRASGRAARRHRAR